MYFSLLVGPYKQLIFHEFACAKSELLNLIRLLLQQVEQKKELSLCNLIYFV